MFSFTCGVKKIAFTCFGENKNVYGNGVPEGSRKVSRKHPGRGDDDVGDGGVDDADDDGDDDAADDDDYDGGCDYDDDANDDDGEEDEEE